MIIASGVGVVCTPMEHVVMALNITVAAMLIFPSSMADAIYNR